MIGVQILLKHLGRILDGVVRLVDLEVAEREVQAHWHLDVLDQINSLFLRVEHLNGVVLTALKNHFQSKQCFIVEAYRDPILSTLIFVLLSDSIVRSLQIASRLRFDAQVTVLFFDVWNA